MSRFAGTSKLVRLALRRDRVKLPVWIASISALTAVSVPALTEVYGTIEAQITYAANVATSSIGRAFGGVPDGPSMGTITMIEMFSFTAVLIAFMSTTAVVRHTRANEESGAAELIGSTNVGRYAALSAAIIVAVGANLITGIIISLLISQIEVFTMAQAFGFGMALAMVGVVFVGIAAITAQLSNSGRGANGLATAAIGLSFLFRAIGDGFAKVNPDGLSGTSAWPSWVSPIGLAYHIFPFTQQNWWIFAVLLAVALVLGLLAYFLLVKRDVGSGLLAEKRGPAHAPASLLSINGLAWRLQRLTLFWWAVFFLVFGLIFGGMANDFEDILQSTDVGREYFTNGNTDIITSFFGFMIAFGAVIAAGYAIMAILKMRSEESSGRLESVLGTSVDRSRWMLSHIAIALLGVVLLLTLISAAAIFMFKATGGNGDFLAGSLIHSLLQIPAVIAFASVAVLTFGLLPKLNVAISWIIFALALVVVQFAPLLELPQWVLNISPFSHTPQIIGNPISWTPLIVMSFIGVVFTVLGIYLFRQRDLDLE